MATIFSRVNLLGNFTFAIFLLVTINSKAQMTINSDFPGGNVVIDSVVVDTVYFRPDQKNNSKEWFYWNFEAISKETKKWYFKAGKKDIMTRQGASFSLDGGQNWHWIKKEDNLSQELFSYEFDTNIPVRLSMGQPYTQSDFERFTAPYRTNKNLKLDYLTTTKKGRKVEKISIGNFDRTPRYKILITTRHHASEMMTSYIVEGIIETLLSDDSEMASLLKTTEIVIIPFVDKDGVEDGDQGKNRQPRDHNRDYSGESIYKETAAIRELKDTWIGDAEWIAIDLHDPWIKGSGAEHIHFVGSKPPKLAAEQLKLVKILQKTAKKRLKSDQKINFLAWGESWNTDGNNTAGNSFVTWAGSFFNEGLRVAATIEYPYAYNDGQIVTAAATRGFGRDLIYALKKYLDVH